MSKPGYLTTEFSSMWAMSALGVAIAWATHDWHCISAALLATGWVNGKYIEARAQEKSK